MREVIYQVRFPSILKIDTEAQGEEVKSNVDFDSTFEQNVNQKIGKFKPNLILQRQTADGKTEVQMYLIVKQ